MVANTIPRASTLNLKSMPGRMVNKFNSMLPPDRIIGAIEATIRNLIMAAINEAVSRTFGFLSRANIKNAVKSETRTARSGLIE